MLDTLDLAVVAALALAVIYYFGKDFIFTTSDGTSAGFVAGGDTSERDIAAKIKNNGKNAIVFYASQTGTAEDYAHKLARDLHSKFGLKVLTADFADFDYDNLQSLDPDCLTFFMIATYGEGEPTDNSVEFFNWLENDADQLATLKFTVFGLGNSTYEFFNAMGTKLNDKLDLLGAERFAPYGQGDDGIGTMDEDFLSWKEECFDSLRQNLSLEERESVYEPSFDLIDEPALSGSDPHVSNGEPNKAYIDGEKDLSRGPFNHTHPYLAEVSDAKELFTSPERSCVHAEFDVSSSNLKYSTGDHLAIWPSNSDQNVSKFVECFGLSDKIDDVFSLKALDSTTQIPFPCPITYSAVIRYHFEVSGPISRQTLTSIAPFAPNDQSKSEAIRLGADKIAFAQEIHDRCFNLADALLYISKGVPWSSVPFVYLIEVVPSLQPRYYSISSSSMSEKQVIHVTAVVEKEVKDDRIVTGVTTNLLKDIEVTKNGRAELKVVTYNLPGPKGKFKNYKLPVHVRRSTFKLPSNPSTPIILVGPGTGIAPMRGFVRERTFLKKSNESLKLGKTILFFGCRKRDEDFLYKDEWPEYAKVLGDSFQMHTAFSRENPAKKNYVQDKILELSKDINDLLQSGAFVYVCGDASRMARDVQNAFVKIISEQRGVTMERAAELVRSLKVQNMYQEDVW